MDENERMENQAETQKTTRREEEKTTRSPEDIKTLVLGHVLGVKIQETTPRKPDVQKAKVWENLL